MFPTYIIASNNSQIISKMISNTHMCQSNFDTRVHRCTFSSESYTGLGIPPVPMPAQTHWTGKYAFRAKAGQNSVSTMPAGQPLAMMRKTHLRSSSHGRVYACLCVCVRACFCICVYVYFYVCFYYFLLKSL